MDRFLDKYLKGYITCVHILPFFPFSSDDGFSVIDYSSVNPSLGDWEHIESISKKYKLMSDVVINHISSRSRWFSNYKNGDDPGKDYFIEANPDDNFEKLLGQEIHHYSLRSELEVAQSMCGVLSAVIKLT